FIAMDTVMVNDKPFLGTGGYGLDALIAKRFDEYHTRGFVSYAKLVLKEFYRFKPVQLQVEYHNEKRDLSVVLCSLANSSEFGNGFCVSPNSHISDGKIELCLLKPFSVWNAPGIIYRFFSRTAERSRFTEIIPIEKARITLVDPL